MQEERKFFNKSKVPAIKIIPVSGLDFIGANCTAFEFGNDIIVVDVGLGFPNADQHGVDCLIPNAKYFRENKKRIKGLVITHGHMDHIGGIPYLLENMGFPRMYATNFAHLLIEENLKSNFPDLLNKASFTIVNPKSTIRLGAFDISFFGVNHSIPESMGVVIKTAAGTIVHSGDFKFDNSPVNEPPAEYAKIAKVGSEGVLCLMSDSTNSYREGHSLSESQITAKLDDVIGEIKGRVVVATFGSMVNRIIELIKTAEKYKRRVMVSGRSMKNAIRIAQKLGYLKVNKELFIRSNEIDKLPDARVMVLATGSQGESLAALSRIAKGEHRDFRVKKGDTIILSASIIPGNGGLVQELIDKLTKLGANVFHNEIMNLHTTGHGHKEEQKLMINLVQPKFFMPIHGFQSFLAEHANTAKSLGIKEQDIIIAQDGDVVEVSQNGWKKVDRLNAKPVFVTGSMVGDVGVTVLEDRRVLSSDGIVVFTLFIDSKTKKLITEPFVTSRGFVYMKFNRDLFNEIKKLVTDVYERSDKTEGAKIDVRELISTEISKFLYEKTEMEPMVLPLVSYL